MNDMTMAKVARVLPEVFDNAFVPNNFAGGAELAMTAYSMALLDCVAVGLIHDDIVDSIAVRADEYFVELMKQAGIKA